VRLTGPTLTPTLTPTLNPTLNPTLTPTLNPTLNPTLTSTLTSTLTPILTLTLTRYDYDAIAEWLTNKQTDPSTNQPLSVDQLCPNRTVRSNPNANP